MLASGFFIYFLFYFFIVLCFFVAVFELIFFFFFLGGGITGAFINCLKFRLPYLDETTQARREALLIPAIVCACSTSVCPKNGCKCSKLSTNVRTDVMHRTAHGGCTKTIMLTVSGSAAR